MVDRHQDEAARGKESVIDEDGSVSVAARDPDVERAELSESDFDDAVRRYRRELHVYCYRMLGSFDDAEDHVQEVLLRAWRSRERFQGRSSPRTWLYRVATNACLDTLRRDTRRPARPGGGSGQPGDDLACLPGDDSATATAPAGSADPARRGQLARRRGRRAARHERPGGQQRAPARPHDAPRSVAGRAAGLGTSRRARSRAAPPAPALHRRARTSRPRNADRPAG